MNLQQQIQSIRMKEHARFRHTVDWDLATEYAARGLSPEARMADRFARLCREEQPVILPDEQICFLRTVSNLPDIFTQEEWASLRHQHYLHEVAFWNNLSPNYGDAIACGLLQKRQSADIWGQQAIDQILKLTERYRQEALRQGRSDLAEVLAQVPAHPARNFREALQSFRILHFSLWLEGEYHNTVGRFDQYIFPYLQRDLESGVHTPESALELLQHFFLSFNKDSDLYFGQQQGDNGQSMMLGGLDADGRDCFNLLSELCLEASRRNGLIDPKINLRVSSKTPQHIFTKASELTKAGLGFPQYSNDDVVIPGLIRLGYEPQDAYNYTVAACWEFIIPGLGMDIANIGALSFPAAVDQAFRKHLLDSDTYEAFFSHVQEAIRNQIDTICSQVQDLWVVPAPFLNVLLDYDMSKGGKYNNYGIHGTGISTAADSLAAIRKYVFEEGSVDKQAYLDAVDSDFAEAPELLHLLRYEAPKLGCNDDTTDRIASDLLLSFSQTLEGRKNDRGGIFRAGTGSAMYYLWHANELGASPDGRRKGEPFGTNYSVSLFARVKGPYSVIASMTKQPLVQAINGGPLTLEFHQSVFNEADGPEKIGLLVKSFVDRGGHQLQLNTVNREQMLDAQKHPELHRNLVVRIWGWSAYFVELDKEFQDHVIARQAYQL